MPNQQPGWQPATSPAQHKAPKLIYTNECPHEAAFNDCAWLCRGCTTLLATWGSSSCKQCRPGRMLNNIAAHDGAARKYPASMQRREQHEIHNNEHHHPIPLQRCAYLCSALAPSLITSTKRLVLRGHWGNEFCSLRVPWRSLAFLGVPWRSLQFLGVPWVRRPWRSLWRPARNCPSAIPYAMPRLPYVTPGLRGCVRGRVRAWRDGLGAAIT